MVSCTVPERVPNASFHIWSGNSMANYVHIHFIEILWSIFSSRTPCCWVLSSLSIPTRQTPSDSRWFYLLSTIYSLPKMSLFVQIYYCDCIEKVGTLTKPKACSNVVWAKQCRQRLLREIVSVSGNTKFYHYRVYCYRSVINSLQRLLLRPGFMGLCESTSKRFLDIPVGYQHDVYHGQIWWDFYKLMERNYFLFP